MKKLLILVLLLAVLFVPSISFGGSDSGVQQIQIGGYTSDLVPNSFRPVKIDGKTGALGTLDYLHHEIHDGYSFFATYTVASLASGSNMDILLVTPNTTNWSHIIYRIRSTLVTTLTIYEAVSTSNDGTGMYPMNADRNSSNVSTLVVTHTPTITGFGTTILTDTWGLTAGGQVRIGGEVQDQEEIILKQNTKYLIRINSGTDTNRVSIKLRWYEHANKS